MSQALENGIAVLEYISSKRASTVTEIANALGLHKSTVSRIIKTFTQKNMVDYNRASKMYGVGPAILQMSSRYYKSHSIVARIKSIMETLAAQTGESVHLCALSNASAVVVEQTEGNNRLVVNAKVGNREPLHASAVGKCLLAFASGEEQEEMLAGYDYKRYTQKTICSKEQLLAELGTIGQSGYALDDNELSVDIRCVAVPIIDSTGKCIYSLGISGANSHMTEERIVFMAQKMMESTKQLLIG
ncbi:MAG: IclR family transcriptional regulator [Christensenellales bacterium]|jgi:IclR family KDG regulon transcriptional repressor